MNERAAVVVSSVNQPPPPVPEESKPPSRNRQIGVAVLEVLLASSIVWLLVLPAIHHGDWFRIVFWSAATVSSLVSARKRVRRLRSGPVAVRDP